MDDFEIDFSEWQGLIDGSPEQAAPVGEDNSNGAGGLEPEDCDLGLELEEWMEVLPQPNPVDPVHHPPGPPGCDVMEAVQPDPDPELSVTMYGSEADMSNMGLPIHKGLFRRFSTAVRTKAYQKKTKEDDLEKEFVLGSTLKSMASAAQHLSMDSRSLTRNLVEYACTLLYGTMFLAGAFLYAFIRVFQTQRYKPLMALSMRKYDETPLKLRVKAYNDLFGTSHKQSSDDQCLHAKIFRISWTYSSLANLV